MKKCILFLLVVLLLCGCATGGEQETTTAETTYATEPATTDDGDPVDYSAPDFTVYDIDGNPVNLSDFEGKPTILNFWASWCGPCKSEMPDLEEAYQEYGDVINFVIVDLTDGSSETVETASAYIESQGYTFPVYYDTDLDGATTYGVTAIPLTYFIDADGNLVAYHQGAMSADILSQGISLIYVLEK